MAQELTAEHVQARLLTEAMDGQSSWVNALSLERRSWLYLKLANIFIEAEEGKEDGDDEKDLTLDGNAESVKGFLRDCQIDIDTEGGPVHTELRDNNGHQIDISDWFSASEYRLRKFKMDSSGEDLEAAEEDLRSKISGELGLNNHFRRTK